MTLPNIPLQGFRPEGLPEFRFPGKFYHKTAFHPHCRPPLYLREGGSVPIIAEIKRVVGLDSVMFGLFLPEDNLHAPTESFNLDVMKKGIETTRRVFAALAKG